MSVVIETTIGAVTVDLYTATRPKLCRNFLKLCKVKFYNFCLFHNVQPRFMAQTGDPGGTGRGGESVFRRLYGDQARFFDGDEDLPKIRHSRRGHISMVGAGDNLFGSQFLITLDDDLGHLDGDNRVFGEVVAVDDDGSLDVLDKFNEVIVDEEQRPFQDVRIAHTVVLDDPFDDPDGLEIPPGSPLPDPEMLKTDRLAADEDVEDDDGGATAEETAERAASKEARAQATILEMIGDLPEADCAPPENVLFVCKLNPVTSDDDLEIIFSRFGKVVNCEVIRDQKTNDSLQYAFVEFEDQKSCEQAYFKMDNVLIDDRRIHVDFSQSVSKYRWKGKGRLEVLEDGGKKKRNRDRDVVGGDDNRAKGDKPKMLYYPAKRAEEYEKGRRSPSPEKVRRRDRSRSREKRRRERSRSGERRKRSRSRSGERRRNRRSKSPEGDRDRRRRRSPPSSDDDERRRRRDKKRRSRSRSAERAQRRRRSRSASRERRRR